MDKQTTFCFLLANHMLHHHVSFTTVLYVHTNVQTTQEEMANDIDPIIARSPLKRKLLFISFCFFSERADRKSAESSEESVREEVEEAINVDEL